MQKNISESFKKHRKTSPENKTFHFFVRYRVEWFCCELDRCTMRWCCPRVPRDRRVQTSRRRWRGARWHRAASQIDWRWMTSIQPAVRHPPTQCSTPDRGHLRSPLPRRHPRRRHLLCPRNTHAGRSPSQVCTSIGLQGGPTSMKKKIPHRQQIPFRGNSPPLRCSEPLRARPNSEPVCRMAGSD